MFLPNDKSGGCYDYTQYLDKKFAEKSNSIPYNDIHKKGRLTRPFCVVLGFCILNVLFDIKDNSEKIG